MSIHFARQVAHNMRMNRAGLGFIRDRKHHTRLSDAGYPPKQQVGLLPMVATQADQRPYDPAATYHDPTPGLARRSTLRKNTSAANGWEFFNNVRCYFESGLEHSCLLQFMTRNDIAEIHSQALLFNYHDEDEKLRAHTVDYLIIYKDELRQAVLIKPERKRGEMLKLIERIKAHPSSTQVDHIKYLSETFGTIEAMENAEFILWSREHHDQAQVDDLLHVVRTINGSVRFGDLLRSCRSVDDRRVAVWRLIDLGILFSPTGERITELTYLARNPAH